MKHYDTWFKSSRSADTANCVEVNAKTETADVPPVGNVEVCFAGPDDIRVRNSADPDGPVLKFNQGEWDAFVEGVRLDEFDL